MNLRKITALALALVMLLALAACGSKAPDDVTPSDEIGDIANTYAPDETPEATDKAEETDEPEPTAEPTPEPTPTPVPPTPTPVPPTQAPVPPTQAPVQSEPPAESTDAPSDGESVDLSAFFNSISATYEFAALADIDTSLLDGYYPGLSAVSTLQLIAKMPMITASGHEIVLVQCENEDDAATVQSILAARKQAQIDGGAFYPATVELWQNAEICVSGCYLMLVSHDNAADIAAAFYALFA